MDAVVRLSLLLAVLAAVLAPAARAQQDYDSDQPSSDGGGGGGGGDLDQDQACQIFGGPACTTEAPIPGLWNPCDCPDRSGDHCECVYFYQCDNSTGAYNKDGVGLLDVRKKDGCPTVELRCCKIDDNQKKREKPVPHKEFPLPTAAPDARGCGVRNEGGFASVIVNNNDGEAGFGEFPWMAAILVAPRRGSASGGDHNLCGGAILNNEVVLTAAHCVRGIAPERMTIRAGEWDRETESELYKHQDRGVRAVLVHDDFYAGNSQFDVALLVLDTPLTLGKHIGSVCLPEPGDGAAYDHQRCVVTGWGKDKLDDQWPHRYLKRLELPVVPRTQCESALRGTRLGPDYTLHHSFLCAGGEAGKDTCKGDGGSPLVCADDTGHYQVVGVVAWGVDCGLPGVPGLYANVPVVREWIDRKLSESGLGPRGEGRE